MYVTIHSPISVFKHQYLQYFILEFTGRVLQSKWEFMHLFTEGFMTSFLLSFMFVLMHHSTSLNPPKPGGVVQGESPGERKGA